MTLEPPKACFTQEGLAMVVIRQTISDMNPRLRAAVKKCQPTSQEWMQELRSLRATGRKRDDWRQAYIRRSDAPRASMPVNPIKSRHPCRPAQLHYILSQDSFDTVTTRIFDTDDPLIGHDPLCGGNAFWIAKIAQIADFETTAEMEGAGDRDRNARFNFIPAPKG